MGDPLVGCASYIFWNFMSNYMARQPHINQYPNVGTSAVAIMCAKLIACHTSGQTKEDYPVWKPSTSLSETSPQLILYYHSMLALYETCIVLSHCDSIRFGNPFPKIFSM